MTVPPDKSVTHRALIFGALSKGKTVIKNPLISLDTVSTLNCIRAMGAEVVTGKEWSVRGGRLSGTSLDCGNSGTTMRLLMGVAATLPSTTAFTGDRSLRDRPMDRVLRPLSLMGAVCEGLKITGGSLKGIDYELPVPSAQVKSAIILAALNAEGETVLRGRTDSRDHTEKMLGLMGGDVSTDGGIIKIKKSVLSPAEFEVAGDPSSAAFAATLALILRDGYIYIRGVGNNPTRLGFFNKLREAGGEVSFIPASDFSTDIEVRYGKIKPFRVTEKEIPYVIDELPLLALVACFAEGESVIEGAGELRFKESNRIVETERLIKALGGEIKVTKDAITVTGRGELAGGGVYEGNDHRMVMTAAVGLAASKKEGVILHPEAAEISYPGFFELFE